MIEGRARWTGAWRLLALPVAAAVLAGVVMAAGGPASSSDPKAVAGMPAGAVGVLGAAPIPAGNPQTAEKAELGRILFFDRRVMNGVAACSGCHDPAKGWSDGLPRSIGPKGEIGRNALSLFNSAWEDFPSWDGSEWSIEQHNADAIKFFGLRVPDMVRSLQTVPEYRQRFGRVFGGEITFDTVVRAIAAFERSLVSFDTPYDRFQAGRTSALTPQQQDGLALFMGRAGCSSCHVPPRFTDTGFHALGVPQAGPESGDLGRFEVTHDERDRGAFRTPTLRNVALTGPYMHDGVFASLDDVVAFYDGGGGPVRGRPGPEIGPLRLSQQERRALVAFLRALTDRTVDTAVPVVPPGG